ncbi:hypothetical protein B0T26DRAFT_679544 [Lasiosphaeria miniovina]|uniref:Uncharacterized protein n=1 Tax=Lasiosphaeria miniovina TaxID=1954250 RepID=A0AA40A6Q6_9PEZI|nr:uncharacterized protein B0T26DRAFT_679544 [Lasiosphaeria miniovina]KAK0710245.1 hypothetical protein B0T26DRAFT_679544 [Lasiosphaeria miniovina]
MQAMLRLAPHPHVLAIDCAVLDEIERKRVAGFTMCLMQAVDDLNLKFGVLHENFRSRKFLTYLDIELVDEADMVRQDKWIKHPEVELDHDIEVFYQEMMRRVRRRRPDGTQALGASYVRASRSCEDLACHR